MNRKSAKLLRKFAKKSDYIGKHVNYKRLKKYYKALDRIAKKEFKLEVKEFLGG